MDRRKFCKIASLAALGTALRASASPLAPDETEPALRACRITVLRRHCFVDLQSRYLDDPETGCCDRFVEGQQFSVVRATEAPEGFCPLAWESIKVQVGRVLDGSTPHRCGLSLPDSRAVIACCGDGTRPVIFKITPA